MCSRRLLVSALLTATVILAQQTSFARETIDFEYSIDAESESWVSFITCMPQHSIGKLFVTISPIGSGWPSMDYPDCLTGQRPVFKNVEYPKGSGLLQGGFGFWVGAVYDGDTVVSTATSFRLCRPMEIRSTLDPQSDAYVGAISQNDYTLFSSDTFPDNTWYTPDYTDGLLSPHIPLNILVKQRSHSWSYEYAEDMVLVDLKIKNIGEKTIENAYIALGSGTNVFYEAMDRPANMDDVAGLLRYHPVESSCGRIDTLYMMWGADNDGDPVYGEFTDRAVVNEFGETVKSSTSVTGVFFLEYPPTTNFEPMRRSYNWWALDWTDGFNFDYGPQRYSTYRDLKTGRWGYPSGDPNRFHYMRNREMDYDPIYTASISPYDSVWTYPPPERAPDISNGMHLEQIFSVGPCTIGPGAEVSVPFAFVAGENFHTDPHNIDNLPYNPDQYYANLDFTDLVKNAQWARWIYDNPGVDTDGDGDSGKTYVCPVDSIFNGSEWVVTRTDTIFYCGDGVPDWRAAVPPPAPVFWLTPLVNGLNVRFNGYRSETEVDVFSKIVDFEGYHIYMGRDERQSSYSIVASYDRENYDKYVLDIYSDDYTYICSSFPFTLDSLRCLYGSGCEDTVFHPLLYPATNPFTHPDFPDSVFFFVAHDFNADDVSNRAPITKIYPDEPNPMQYHPDSIPDEAYTEDGYLKYFEYEFTIENLLATISYWVNVTAFDFGDARVHMRPLESGITAGAKSAYPMGAMEATAEGRGKVYVYPNPYRGDADYRDHGFEGRTEDDRPDNRVRAINFANLPPKCKIYIYSLDGDLIRQLDHDMDPADPNHRHHVWNMITRNTQMIVTGIYYWVVETDDGSTQMGKLVVIF